MYSGRTKPPRSSSALKLSLSTTVAVVSFFLSPQPATSPSFRSLSALFVLLRLWFRRWDSNRWSTASSLAALWSSLSTPSSLETSRAWRRSASRNSLPPTTSSLITAMATPSTTSSITDSVTLLSLYYLSACYLVALICFRLLILLCSFSEPDSVRLSARAVVNQRRLMKIGRVKSRIDVQSMICPIFHRLWMCDVRFLLICVLVLKKETEIAFGTLRVLRDWLG